MRVVLRLAIVLMVGACAGSAPEPSSKKEPDTLKFASAAEENCLTEAAATPERKADEPVAVTVKHILVKYAPAEGVKRTRGQACLRALEVIDKLKGGAEFDALVGEYSDEAGAATRAGAVGKIKRDEVEAPFADAAFALEVDQVSHVVETKKGFHVIFRTE